MSDDNDIFSYCPALTGPNRQRAHFESLIHQFVLVIYSVCRLLVDVRLRSLSKINQKRKKQQKKECHFFVTDGLLQNEDKPEADQPEA